MLQSLPALKIRRSCCRYASANTGAVCPRRVAYGSSSSACGAFLQSGLVSQTFTSASSPHDTMAFSWSSITKQRAPSKCERRVHCLFPHKGIGSSGDSFNTAASKGPLPLTSSCATSKAVPLSPLMLSLRVSFPLPSLAMVGVASSMPASRRRERSNSRQLLSRIAGKRSTYAANRSASSWTCAAIRLLQSTTNVSAVSGPLVPIATSSEAAFCRSRCSCSARSRWRAASSVSMRRSRSRPMSSSDLNSCPSLTNLAFSSDRSVRNSARLRQVEW
mmetsp:Transcript_89995/g.178893  ORF Transcript_89995/g.178893 Transcript_89995/m.178893 type:complete len:275 (-) Transcript_89995:154-978(-)